MNRLRLFPFPELYSSEGNTSPYTGETGTDRYIHNPSSPYYGGAER
jgi:hypothetical protein